MRDRRKVASILAVVMLLAVRGTSVGAAVASNGVTRGTAAGGAVWQQQATAGKSSAAPQSSGTQQGPNPQPGDSATHSITVQFDYDFTKTPACSTKVTNACVKTFDVYDISGDKPYLLFSIPVPQNAQGAMKGITATSPRMLFAVGKHRIGVSARMPDGEKSPPRDCKVIIEIKADNPPNPPASN
ncbi:MAG TPA: hypothetical protein VIH88_09575 [Candidatus Acidoferrales bacterium]